MLKEIILSEMERDRANELRLRSLLEKMLEASNDNFAIVQEYITYLSSFLDFDLKIIMSIILEIFDYRYKPTINELIKINLLFGLTIREIAEKLNMKVSTVKMHIYRNKYNIDTIILYPRLNPEQSKELKRFWRQYYQLYVPIDKISIS